MNFIMGLFMLVVLCGMSWIVGNMCIGFWQELMESWSFLLILQLLMFGTLTVTGPFLITAMLWSAFTEADSFTDFFVNLGEGISEAGEGGGEGGGDGGGGDGGGGC